MPCPAVLGLVQIIDSGIPVIFGYCGMGGNRVADLYCRIAVEIRIIGQHPAKHGDINRPVRFAQDHLFQVLILGQFLTRQNFPRQVLGQRPFRRRDKGQCCPDLILCRLFVRGFQLAENCGHLFRRLHCVVNFGTIRHQFITQVFKQPFGPCPLMIRQIQSEKRAFPHCTLHRLRRQA